MTDRHARDTVELRIRTHRANLAGIMSIYGIGVSSADDLGITFGPGGEIVEDVKHGMNNAYPKQARLADITTWATNDVETPDSDVDVELVEVDGQHDDGNEEDKNAIEVPITDDESEGGSP